ncbi:MAG: hypothetical protein RL432_305 [Bacteroidota bacterium]|jgi:hypothetical protein
MLNIVMRIGTNIKIKRNFDLICWNLHYTLN